MSKNPVKIYFGPYEAHWVIRHRPHRVRGCSNRLSALGYEVEVIPIRILNLVWVEMGNRQVFRCDIRNLKFNMDIEDDVVGIRLVDAVLDAQRRFGSVSNLPRFGSCGNLLIKQESILNETLVDSLSE